jgi:hypothetical protein
VSHKARELLKSALASSSIPVKPVIEIRVTFYAILDESRLNSNVTNILILGVLNKVRNNVSDKSPTY